MAVSETWLSKDIVDDEVQIPGYRLFRTDRFLPEDSNRQLSGHGGVCLYVRDDLRATAIFCKSTSQDSPRLEIVLVRLNSHDASRLSSSDVYIARHLPLQASGSL